MDPEVLRRCVPGCETFTETRPNSYAAKNTLAVGPVRATFDSQLALMNINEPESYRIRGSTRAGPVGFGQGYVDVRLEKPEPGTTVLTYTAAFQVGGQLAQIGSRLVQAATQKIADDFFEALVAELDRTTFDTEPTATAGRQRRCFFLVAGAVAVTVIIVAVLLWRQADFAG